MQRFTYSPKVWAYIQTDDGMVDVSDYITQAQVARRMNAVSSAQLTLRNPNFRFTKKLDKDNTVRPVFLPMDGITIFMERLPGYPIQVFTGYLDSAPYLQLFPGTVSLTASCTMKRILQTYFDPNLFATAQFLRSNGWIPTAGDGTAISQYDKLIDNKSTPAYDGSFSHLLFRTLHEIGNWHPDQIHILPIPDAVVKVVTDLFTKITKDEKATSKEFQEFMRQLLGPGNFSGLLAGGTASGTGASSGGGGCGQWQTVDATWFSQTDGGGSPACGHGWGYNGGMFYAELGLGAGLPLGPLFGMSRLPCDFELEVRNPRNGKTLNLKKNDNGGGAPGAKIDLFRTASDALGFTNVGNGTVEIRRVTGCPPPAQSAGTGTSPAPNPPPGHRRQIQPANPSHPSNQPASSNTVVFPLQAGTYVGEGSWSLDQGVDISTNGGGCGGAAPLLAMGDGTIVSRGMSGFGNDAPTLHLDNPIAGYNYIYYGHAGNAGNSSGCQNPPVSTHVTAGQVIGCVGCGKIGYSSGPHLEVGFASGPNQPAGRGTADTMLATLKAAKAGQPVPGGGTGSGGSTGGGAGAGGIDVGTMVHISKSVLFSTLIDFPTEGQIMEAEALTGKKGLMLDTPLLPFIEQLCMATQRIFMSLPNGDFIAFFPDYFGGLSDRSPYWEIDNIEILQDDGSGTYPSGTIYLNDDALATHVYTVGDIVGYGSDNLTDKILSAGVMDIGMAFAADFINGSYLVPKTDAIIPKSAKGKVNSGNLPSDDILSDLGEVPLSRLASVQQLLQRYGARPYYEFAPFIRSPYYETFYAYQKFMLMWARQFTSNFTFTFMPELYPGGIVNLKDHGLQFFVEEVTHTCDYVSGFTTDATLIAPADTSHKSDINQGLLRSNALTANR